MNDDDAILYHLMINDGIYESFTTLAAARRYAEGVVGHDVALWDSDGCYYGVWRYKEGWIH